MADATTVHAWMVAPARRRAAAPALARQPAWPAAGTSTRLGLSHPQTHPAAASTICPRSAGERDTGLEPLGERDEQADGRLDVAEVDRLDRCMHVPKRNGHETCRNAHPAQVDRVGVGERVTARYLHRDRNTFGL